MNLKSHPVVSHEQWVGARRALLAKEKEWQNLRDDIARQRRELPWEKVEKNYVFDTPAGKKSLADLFDGRNQLVVYHLMFGPGWKEACPNCAYLMDHVDGALPHLHHRDVTFTAISRATLAEIEPFKKRMGWKFPWASSNGTDFNFDYGVSFRTDELDAGSVNYNYEPMKPPPFQEFPGLSVFYKDDCGRVFHTYSTYARGLDIIVGTYVYLDLVPKGRDEEGLKHSMSWVRYHDRYDGDYKVDPNAPYTPPEGAIYKPCCAGKDK